MGLKLLELKVTDLKAELEKRELDKTGVKSVLVERLRNALEEEGLDCEEYEFDNVDASNVRNSKRKSETSVNSDLVEDEEMDAAETTYNSEASDKPIVLDDDDDTPCSDEEEMDTYSKHKEKSESNRFKSDPSDDNIKSNDVENATEENAKIESSETPVKSVSGEDSPQNDSATAPSDAAVSPIEKSNKNKVLKVVSKDKGQQATIIARTLWVTGLASTSKVSDLKNLFSKHGKVASAKIVRSTKGTQIKWYGLLTMATGKDASTCIQKLHRTEFGGHAISVERRQAAPILKKSEPSVVKKQAIKSDLKSPVAGKSDGEAKKTPSAEGAEVSKSGKETAEGEGGKRGSDDERGTPERGYRGDRPYFRGRYIRGSSFRRPFGFRGRGTMFRGRGRFTSFRRPFGRGSFERPSFGFSSRGSSRFDFKNRGGRFPPRDYMREREMRERRDDEMFRHKIIVRKQREEAFRLEKEKNQLRLEREMLEREKAEMLKIERAKQRMEREQLEHEREKLRRQSEMSHMSKRPYMRRGGGSSHVWAEKRRESPYDPDMSFHRQRFPAENKFPYPREHSGYKKPEFEHEEFRREKPDMPPPHMKFGEPREDRREVSYRGDPDRRVYSRSEFRGPPPGPSDSPKHFIPKHKSPREEWKFQDRRGGRDKMPYGRGGGHKRMASYY